MNRSVGNHWNGRLKLLGAVTILAVIWLGVLPQLQRIPWVQQRSQMLKDAGIETDAMFYTDLNWDATNDRLPDPQP